MVILLITSVLLLSLIAVAIYFLQKPARTVATTELPAPQARSLFDTPTHLLTTPTPNDLQEQRAALLALASAGHQESLSGAIQIDKELYDDCLNTLVSHCEHASKVSSILFYVTQQQFPVNKSLATAIMAAWQDAPDRFTTAKMLHTAALSDDAETYNAAVELVLSYWRDGRLPQISTSELLALFTSEFWVLSSSTRSSGAGFLLKRTLATAQRELNDRQPTD